MRYLLDTNILSDLVRNPKGAVASRIRRVGEGNVCTSIIVSSELRYGARKKGSTPLEKRVEALLGLMAVLPLEAPADTVYAEVRCALERAGTPIGANDLWLAAQAMAWNLVLVTDNSREFGRVPGLRWEDWLERST